MLKVHSVQKVIIKIMSEFSVKARLIKTNSKSRQSGFNLIEVMIAALIVSVGILGVAGLQITSLKGTHQSFMKQQAMGVMQNLIERMRSNQAGVVAGSYVFDSASVNCAAPVPSCSVLDCNADQIALRDTLNLVCGYKSGVGNRTGGVKMTSASDNLILANGTLSVACRDCSVGDLTISIGWTERAIGQEIPQADSITLDTRVLVP